MPKKIMKTDQEKEGKGLGECQLLGDSRWYEKDLGNAGGQLHSFQEFNNGVRTH